MTEKMICAGFGGQGVLSLGKIISLLAIDKGLNTTWMPSYGAEMRGGTANCSVVYSDKLVGSPILGKDVSCLIAMNGPSLDKFENNLATEGLVIVNSSVVTQKVERTDLKTIYVEATDIASEIGNIKVANMVMLGAYMKATGFGDITNAEKVFKEVFGGKKEKFIPLNLEAFEKGYNSVK